MDLFLRHLTQTEAEMSSEKRIELAAGVLVLNERREVLLIKRRADAPVSAGLWTRPIGKVEFGETGIAAAIRETLEETDVVVAIPNSIPHNVWESIDVERGRHCVVREYVGRYVSGEAWNTEPDRHDDVKWFPPTDLPANLSHGTKKAVDFLLKA